jgi:Outer membrane protein beta-barrel domain
MKKIVLFMACVVCAHGIGAEAMPLSSLSEISAKVEESTTKAGYSKNKARGLNIEVKGGYFIFSDHTMRKVYDQGGEDIQLCFSYPIWKIWNIYGSIEYLERYGRSLNDHQRTRIQELPLTLGLKPVFPISSAVDYYFTLGPRYTFVWVKNHSSYVDKNMHKSGFGGFAGTGFIFHVGRHWTLDLFGEYAYTKLHFHSSKHNVIGESRQVGGFTFGLGLGYTI